MITLTSVELHNFRGVKEATFTPLEGGLTGLSGDNGAGKSSFLEGALWAMYGSTPDATKQAELRREGTNPKTDPCYVQVTFTHNQQTIVVKRELHGKTGAVMHTWLDGEVATTPSVSVGETWLKNRLGIDEQGFTTAFVVKQKDLDNLVKATPAIRRSTIERLSGIDKLSTALKFARDEYNGLKNYAANASGSEEEVEEAETAYNTYVEHTNELKSERIKTKTAYETFLTQKFNPLNQKERQLSELITQNRELKTQIDTQQGIIQARQNTINNLATQINQTPDLKTLETRLAEITVRGEEISTQIKNENTQIEDLQTQLTQSRNHHLEKTGLLARQQTKIEQKQTQIGNIDNQITQATQKIGENLNNQTLKQLEKEVKENIEKQTSLTKTLNDTNKEISDIQATIDSHQDAINTLHDHEDGICPTCLSTITNLKNVLKTLREEQTKAQARLGKTQTKQAKITKDLQTQIEHTQNQVNAIKLVNELESNIVELKTQKTLIASELQDLTGETQALNETIQNILDQTQIIEKRLQVHTQTISALSEEHAQKTEEWKETKTSISLHENYQNERDLAEQDQQTLTELKTQNKNITVPTDQEYATVREELENAIQQKDHLANEYHSTAKEEEVAQERANTLKLALAHAQQQLENRKTLLRNLEEKSGAVSVIDEFRKSLIASIAPELSENASTLVSSMTAGEFSEIQLDENFTPTVILSNGSSRPVGTLSGGELSVVALALRIAIGDLITGGRGGLLWLDEVLVSQDASRRASLIDTIRALNGRQVILINHTTGANDIVDKNIKLVKTGDGTVIEEM